MMEDFARRPRTVRLLWIASFRLTQVIAEDHPLRELRQELRLHRLCDEILLDPFAESEVGAYVARRLPDARVSEDFVRRLHVHTGGLPLFVANVTDALLEQVTVDPASGERRLDAGPDALLPVPDSLAGVMEKQIARLSAETQALLEAASVVGMEFRASTVGALLRRESGWVIDRCDELVRRQCWLGHLGIVEQRDGSLDARYAFLHALYRHVFYRRMTTSQRVQHHRGVARALEHGRAAGEIPAPAELASHYERGHETLAALRAYAQAAQGALGQFAPGDAAQLSAHALALLDRIPQGEERLDVELSLLRPHGVAASLLDGLASEPARAAFERIRELCELLPQTPARAVALNGMGWMRYVRGEFDEALGLASRLEEIAERHDDSVLRVFACNLAGVSLIGQGRLAPGCDALGRGIELCRRLGDDVPLTAFVIDPEASMLLNVAVPLMDRGLADQARAQLALGTERAERIGQPIARMLACWCGGMLGVRADDPQGVARHAATLAKIVEAAMLAQGQGPALWLRGWAEARLGDPRAGHRLILEGFACHARLGMYAGCPEVLGYAAEALIVASDWPAAQVQLDDAFALARRIGERLVLPRLHRLQARIALGRGDPAAARAALDESLREARAQEALGHELSALAERAGLEGRDDADLAALAAARARLSEGFDTPLYRRACELLAV
jgi:hypothetical protein